MSRRSNPPKKRNHSPWEGRYTVSISEDGNPEYRLVYAHIFRSKAEALIRALRKDHDLSQTAIAALLNIGQRTYCESGKIRIPIESMLILAKYYDVSMDYLCGISEKKGRYPRE